MGSAVNISVVSLHFMLILAYSFPFHPLNFTNAHKCFFVFFVYTQEKSEIRFCGIITNNIQASLKLRDFKFSKPRTVHMRLKAMKFLLGVCAFSQ